LTAGEGIVRSRLAQALVAITGLLIVLFALLFAAVQQR
jgi:hypothetical protein